jgi:hypothetical protein
MWENIGDVMGAESSREFHQATRLTEAWNGVGLLIANEPVVSAQPAVLEPDGIPASVVTTIADIQTGTPEKQTTKNK